jgi:hypothetical protein
MKDLNTTLLFNEIVKLPPDLTQEVASLVDPPKGALPTGRRPLPPSVLAISAER